MKKYDFVCLLPRGILPRPASGICMTLWNYSKTETLTFILNGLEAVSQKSERYSHGDAHKVSETGLTLSISLRVKAVASAILLTLSDFISMKLNYFRLTNPRFCSIILLKQTRSSKSFLFL